MRNVALCFVFDVMFLGVEKSICLKARSNRQAALLDTQYKSNIISFQQNLLKLEEYVPHKEQPDDLDFALSIENSDFAWVSLIRADF